MRLRFDWRREARKAAAVGVALVLAVVGLTVAERQVLRSRPPRPGRAVEVVPPSPLPGQAPSAAMDPGPATSESAPAAPVRRRPLALAKRADVPNLLRAPTSRFALRPPAEGEAAPLAVEPAGTTLLVLEAAAREGRRPPAAAIGAPSLLAPLALASLPHRTAKDAPIEVRAAVTTCPWAEERRLAVVSLRGRTRTPERPALTAALVLPHSLRTEEAARPLRQRLRYAVHHLLPQLRSADRLLFVSPARPAPLLQEATAAEAKTVLASWLEPPARSPDAAGDGDAPPAPLAPAFAAALDRLSATDPARPRRLLLCLGDAEAAQARGLLPLFAEAARRGVPASVLLLAPDAPPATEAAARALAHRGEGRYAAPRGYAELTRSVLRCIDPSRNGAAPVARDVEAQVVPNPKTVSAFRIPGLYAAANTRESSEAEANALFPGETWTALVELAPTATDGETGSTAALAHLRLRATLEGGEAWSADLVLRDARVEPEGDAFSQLRLAAALAEAAHRLGAAEAGGAAEWNACLERIAKHAHADPAGMGRYLSHLLHRLPPP